MIEEVDHRLAAELEKDVERLTEENKIRQDEERL